MYAVSKAKIEDLKSLTFLDESIAGQCIDSVRLMDSSQAWRSWIDCGLIYKAVDGEGELVAAVVAFSSKGKGWCVHKLLVTNAYLQSNVAMSLLDALLGSIDRREDDASVVVHPNDFFTIKLYTQLGFIERTLHPSYLAEGEDRIVMFRPINWSDMRREAANDSGKVFASASNMSSQLKNLEHQAANSMDC